MSTDQNSAPGPPADIVERVRAMLAKAVIPSHLTLRTVQIDDSRLSIWAESAFGKFLLCRIQFDNSATEGELGLCDIFAAAHALLCELVVEIERLRDVNPRVPDEYAQSDALKGLATLPVGIGATVRALTDKATLATLRAEKAEAELATVIEKWPRQEGSNTYACGTVHYGWYHKDWVVLRPSESSLGPFSSKVAAVRAFCGLDASKGGGAR